MVEINKELSPDRIREEYWETRLSRYETCRKPAGGNTERYALLIGLAVPIVLFFLGLKTMAIVAASVFAIITVGSLLSPRFKLGLKSAAKWLSIKVGTLLTWLFLAPIYVLGFSFVRFMQWVGRDDRLFIRTGKQERSMWLSADLAERKSGSEKSMFCTERLPMRRFGLAKWALLLLVLLVLGEVFLRSKGYDKPLLYMNDVYAGYRIQPNQHVRWEGGEVFINNYGMRNRYDVEVTKPADTFRVLLVGDSTLYGNDDLAQDVIYSERLEKLLSGLVPGRRVEVLNLGVNGAGPHQNLGALQRYPHAFGSDVVLGCFPLGDVYRAKQDMTLSRWQMNRPRLAWETAVIYYLPVVRASLNNRNTYKTVENPQYDPRELLEDGTSAYGDFVTKAKSAGSESWLEILPQLFAGVDADAGVITTAAYQSDFDYFTSEMTKKNINVYLPLDVFKGAGKTANVWHDLAHMGPQGHQYYAEYLCRQIVSHSEKWQAFQTMPKEEKP